MRLPLFVLSFFSATYLFAQDDLLSLLGKDSVPVEYTTASFKTTRVINGHSLENTAHGVMDVKIQHRFGLLSQGTSNFFGLDEATIRIGLDYGLTDRIMIGIGRSSFEKTLDGFVKYKLLRQCDSGCGMPITLAILVSGSMTTLAAKDVPWYGEGRTDYFTHRLSNSIQLIFGRKFSKNFTFQFMPGVVHRNLVTSPREKNDILFVGAAGRYKLTRRLALNGECFYILPEQGWRSDFQSSVSFGFDIETGGHVFQLHFTNSKGMYERAYIAETSQNFFKGDIMYGFNISRVFTIHDPKKKLKEKMKAEGK